MSLREKILDYMRRCRAQNANSLGAVCAMTLSVLWFIGYCNADRLS